MLHSSALGTRSSSPAGNQAASYYPVTKEESVKCGSPAQVVEVLTTLFFADSGDVRGLSFYGRLAENEDTRFRGMCERTSNMHSPSRSSVRTMSSRGKGSSDPSSRVVLPREWWSDSGVVDKDSDATNQSSGSHRPTRSEIRRLQRT